MTINAYYDRSTIYTTLKFPIIAYPTYKIIKPTPIPTHDHRDRTKLCVKFHYILFFNKKK